MTPEQAALKVKVLYKQLAERRPEVVRLNDYYAGKQPLAYASDQWRSFHQDRYRGFADNWCGVVANSPSERLRVDGFRVGDAADPVTEAERELWRWWRLNEMDGQSSQGFLQSIIARRSAVLVWGNRNDEPVVTWEHPEQVFIEYDPADPRVRRFGLKAWVEDDRENATLYTPDEVWKFSRPSSALTLSADAKNWQPREVVGESWPLVNPFGLLPLVEFPNRPMLGRGPMSDIDGTVAMQNAINLLWAYLFTAADHASMPARVVMGQEPPKIPILDDSGNKVGEKPVDLAALAQGRLLWLTGQNTKIGQWDSAKLDVFTEVINRAVRHTAAQTRTPVHYIVGELNNVNGETLIAGETGLVKKVEESQLFFGPAVREVFRLISLVRGDSGLAEACRLGDVMWKDAETRSQSQLADALLKWRDVGFPFQWLARKAGLSQTQIEDVLAMREAEADDPTMARIMREIRTEAPAV